jgi:hypothetical protein
MQWELVLFFAIIAFIYSSVGFGGGSSYLALLAVYGLPIADMKLTALVCNIIVVTGGTLLFVKNRQLDIKKTLPLVIASIPLAYLGGQLKLQANVFFTILGFSLILAGILLLLNGSKQTNRTQNYLFINILWGGSIGFLSGIAGIGGGIFLSPVLHLSRWDTAKKIAAAASFFILVNSLSGIAAQLNTPHPGINYKQLMVLAVAVFVGGQVGSRVSIRQLQPAFIKKITGALVLAAGIEVLYKHLFLPLIS